jgi:hypothetical protein
MTIPTKTKTRKTTITTKTKTRKTTITTTARKRMTRKSRVKKLARNTRITRKKVVKDVGTKGGVRIPLRQNLTELRLMCNMQPTFCYTHCTGDMFLITVVETFYREITADLLLRYTLFHALAVMCAEHARLFCRVANRTSSLLCYSHLSWRNYKAVRLKRADTHKAEGRDVDTRLRNFLCVYTRQTISREFDNFCRNTIKIKILPCDCVLRS